MVTRRYTRDDLLAQLAEAGVPAGPINSVADAFADPQIIARGMQLALHADDGTPIPGVRTPIRFAGLELATDQASPRKGQHGG